MRTHRKRGSEAIYRWLNRFGTWNNLREPVWELQRSINLRGTPRLRHLGKTFAKMREMEESGEVDRVINNEILPKITLFGPTEYGWHIKITAACDEMVMDMTMLKAVAFDLWQLSEISEIPFEITGGHMPLFVASDLAAYFLFSAPHHRGLKVMKYPIPGRIIDTFRMYRRRKFIWNKKIGYNQMDYYISLIWSHAAGVAADVLVDRADQDDFAATIMLAKKILPFEFLDVAYMCAGFFHLEGRPLAERKYPMRIFRSRIEGMWGGRNRKPLLKFLMAPCVASFGLFNLRQNVEIA
ncbi:MAG: hypothetical protein KatS3mg054_0133 [Chloroflexus sp.]|nr:MAG: hypothetical protein KatS3mg054_0133 [Chloroflexus sp.]